VRSYWVYILASKPRGTLYIGVTNGLIFRLEQHRAGKGASFTRKYRVHQLVWFQEFSGVREAIQREKTMKEWPRAWKVNLIERENPHWSDLYSSLPGVRPQSIKGAR
jgi:putative endonuclease